MEGEKIKILIPLTIIILLFSPISQIIFAENQIINNITSLYNLDPNFGEFPEREDHEIPMILKNDVFLPYIDSIANPEEEAIEKIAERIGLRLIDRIFLAPQEDFADLLLENNILYFLAHFF